VRCTRKLLIEAYADSTSVHFPGSRQYTSIGEIENSDELGDAEAGDIVKVVGTKEVCGKAAELLQVIFKR